jgi:NhaP-type Na+/H+ or K+/H+ antiporter
MKYDLLETLGIVFALGMLSQWIGWKFKFPVIILLTISGLIAGPGLGWIQPYVVFGDLLNPLIELGVAIILFEGGLLLKAKEFKDQSSGMMRLFSFAVLLNWSIGTAASYFIAGLSFEISLLISGILIVTGPTVIIPALREAKLKRKVSNYLKWEGIINDPVGAVIAVLVYEYIIYSNQLEGTSLILISVFKVFSISLTMGFGTKSLILWLSKRALVPEFLKIPFLISCIIILFIFADELQKGAGLLTITLFGILLGNSNYSSLKDIKHFGESVSVFTVSAVFIILSASLDIMIWQELNIYHLALIFLFSFIIRPVSILLSTVKSDMEIKERILIGLYGPRGIVAASVAGAVGTGLVQSGFEEGKYVLPIIFSVIIVTVIFHSGWLGFLSIKLDLRNEGEHGVIIVGASPWTVQLTQILEFYKVPVIISDVSWYKLTRARIRNMNIHHGQILNDIDDGEIDLNSMNYLLALTEDDNYNSLVCHKLEHQFGKEHVYQLHIHEDTFRKQHGLSSKDFCTLSESLDALYENMMRNYYNGWNFESIVFGDKSILEKFSKEESKYEYINFLVIKANKRVEIIKKESELDFSIGDVLVYYKKEAISDV